MVEGDVLWKITTRCLIGVAVPEVIQLLAELVWVWETALGAAFAPATVVPTARPAATMVAAAIAV